MESKIEQLEHSNNKLNSFYFKCETCGKVIPPLFGYLSSNDKIADFCSCKNPYIDGTIYIDKIKE